MESHPKEGQSAGGRFSKEKAGFLSLLFTNLSFLDVSTENERIFIKVAMLESKQRADHLHLWNLFDSLVVACRFPSDVAAYAQTVPAGLTPEKSTVLYKVNASDILQAARTFYSELYPTPRGSLNRQRVSPTKRQLESDRECLRQNLTRRLPKLRGSSQKAMPAGKISETEHRSRWTASIQVLSRDAGKSLQIAAETLTLAISHGCKATRMIG